MTTFRSSRPALAAPSVERRRRRTGRTGTPPAAPCHRRGRWSPVESRHPTSAYSAGRLRARAGRRSSRAGGSAVRLAVARRGPPPAAAPRCSSSSSRACRRRSTGTASMSPRRGSGSSTRSISTSPDSQCLPATAYGAGRRLVGPVRRAAPCSGRRRARGAGCPTCRRRPRRRSSLPRALHRADACRASRPARATSDRPGSRITCGGGSPCSAQARSSSSSSARTNSPTAELRLVRRCTRRRGRRRGRSSAASSRARRGARGEGGEPVDASSAPRRRRSSCEPMCTCRPSVSGRAARSASSASSGGSPNFEPWWPVRIASCVSASMPGVTRIERRAATPAARARSISSSESSDDERARLGGGARAPRRTCCCRARRAGRRAIPAALREARARRASRRRRRSPPRRAARSSATFGNAFVP